MQEDQSGGTQIIQHVRQCQLLAVEIVSFILADKYLAVRLLLFLNRPPQRHMLSVKESMKAL